MTEFPLNLRLQKDSNSFSSVYHLEAACFIAHFIDFATMGEKVKSRHLAGVLLARSLARPRAGVSHFAQQVKRRTERERLFQVAERSVLWPLALYLSLFPLFLGKSPPDGRTDGRADERQRMRRWLV